MRKFGISILLVLVSFSSFTQDYTPINFSGIYPGLAMYNNEGECGTGAVVPFGAKLWVITYAPHWPFGSSDKLYEISPDLQQKVREESIGGTCANRMIHKESNQLFIGPYAIDAKGNVRAIPYSVMPGRHTGTARHLYNPANKIYTATMEEGLYEIDVNTLDVKELYRDANFRGEKRGIDVSITKDKANLPGAHGKGLYSGQGVVVYSNNGENSKFSHSKFDVEAGVLAEWNGKEWTMIRRNQFVEVTGPGGIYGNRKPATDPIWATGWDHKSVLVGVRNAITGWSFYRLPKASHTYDGAHGWNTEWPRIRDIGTTNKPDYLMTMHGLFWKFPHTFSSNNSLGIRPRSAYLKVIGDYALWNNLVVFGCDDSAQKEFLNVRKMKGTLEGPGQSNSNLWFVPANKLNQFGPNTAEGAIWIADSVKAGVFSEPFLFAGWDLRSAWIKNEGSESITFSFDVDKKGNNSWSTLKTVIVLPGNSVNIVFSQSESGEWVRVKTDKDTKATVHFSYTQTDDRITTSDKIFSGISSVQSSESHGGLLWALGNNRRKLGVLAGQLTNNKFEESGYYELDSLMNLVRVEDLTTTSYIREKVAIPKQVVTIDEASVLIVDDRNRRWRLPKGDNKFDALTNNGLLRVCREVATERDLFQCSGTFYELPAENADGFAKIRPVSSHNFRIHDYASYRGMLIMTGIDPQSAIGNSHIILSSDKKAAVWAGVIDDLWKLGKPVGKGGPWKNSVVKPGVASDPYLIGFFDKRNLTLNHDLKESVTFNIEVEPIGHGPWMVYKTITVKPGETFKYAFPNGFQSRWIRFVADKNCSATAWLTYY
jgi:hypothetical protein